LCGRFRPGHFTGVATVVCKLFNMVQPDLAVFGEKDYQQLVVIRCMTRDFCLPVEIVGSPTIREPDGVAMSSRNRYLSEEERGIAPTLFRLLQTTADKIRSGATDLSALEREAMTQLQTAGFRPDYFAVRDAETLEQPTSDTAELRILAAAWLGKARLIDNVGVSRTA
ncbi:MAG: pantoate--beta-alanine ligase, partial [Gammaproteobacteria bacterium]